MADPREIPQLARELYDMSREYLRQETLEPAKKLGRYAGFGIGGAALVGLGGVFLTLGLYGGLKRWLPEGEWYVVLARVIAAVASALVAGLVVWRMQSDDK